MSEKKGNLTPENAKRLLEVKAKLSRNDADREEKTSVKGAESRFGVYELGGGVAKGVKDTEKAYEIMMKAEKEVATRKQVFSRAKDMKCNQG